MHPPNYRKLLVSLYDLCAVAGACVAAVMLRLDGLPPNWILPTVTFSLTVTLIAIPVFPLIGINRGIWRYAGLRDTLAILYGSTITIVLSVVVLFFATRLHLIPRTAILNAWMIMILLLVMPRFFMRGYRENAFRLGRTRYPKPNPALRNLLVIGINDEAEAFIRFLNRHPKPEYNVIGIVATGENFSGHYLRGVPVISMADGLEKMLDKLRRRSELHGIILSQSNMINDELRLLLDFSAKNELRVYRFPDRRPNPFEERGLLENIRVEDLLQREPVMVDIDGITRLLKGKSVMVTGCSGTIGSALIDFVLFHDIGRLVILDNSEIGIYRTLDRLKERAGPEIRQYICSVTDQRRIAAILEVERPHYVFHTAALKHVDLVEANPEEGVLVNVFGTRHVADAAYASGAEAFILVSTDKAVAPASVMGASKRIAERYVQLRNEESSTTRFITVRFGNVLGSSGSVVPAFEKQIRKGGPVVITDPAVERYFMTPEEARMLIIYATLIASRAKKFQNRICVLDMGEPVLIKDLAEQMILLAGKRPRIDIPITYCGLRPGEKLQEQLIDSNEILLPEESLEGVLIVRSHPIEQDAFLKALGQLHQSCVDNDRSRLFETLDQLVPTAVFKRSSLPEKQMRIPRKKAVDSPPECA